MLPLRRCFASGDRPQEAGVRRLVCAGGTDAGKLAGAICGSIRLSGAAVVVAMGPSAVHRALRSVSIAGEFMREERPSDDVGAAVTQHAVGSDGTDVEMRLLVACYPQASSRADSAKEKDVLVAQATNVGKVASFLAKAMDEENWSPVLHGMGHQAISQALKASVVARKYAKLEEGEDLIVVPRIIKTYVTKDASRKRVEMVLRLRRSKRAEGAAPAAKVPMAASKKASIVVKV